MIRVMAWVLRAANKFLCLCRIHNNHAKASLGSVLTAYELYIAEKCIFKTVQREVYA